MEIIFRKQFKKKFKKLPMKVQDRFHERLELFIKNKTHITLNNHFLNKPFADCRSINITGDYRAIFTEENNAIIFITIGTHAELY